MLQLKSHSIAELSEEEILHSFEFSSKLVAMKVKKEILEPLTLFKITLISFTSLSESRTVKAIGRELLFVLLSVNLFSIEMLGIAAKAIELKSKINSVARIFFIFCFP